jgi:SAM-dependent methyltransferase
VVPLGARILDLGCGDGYLAARLIARGHPPTSILGLDVSAPAVAVARACAPTARWLVARAQALPLATGSVDVVASHLAWTLFPDLDTIADEVARVLAPAGRFVAVVGGGPSGDDAFAGLLALAQPWLHAAAPIPRLGDRRARTDAGLHALLSRARGFAAVEITDTTVDLSGSPEAVWSSLAPSYELATLDDRARADLAAAFLAAAPRWRRADGAIAATMYVRRVVATR